MPTNHTVKERECIDSIAALHGVLATSLWEAPDNATLKELRKDGNVLLAGDVVVIPDKQVRWDEVQTQKRWKLRSRAPTTKVTLRLLDGTEPRKDVPFLAEVDGDTIQGKSGPDGLIEFAVPVGTEKATIEITQDEGYELLLGRLDPASEPAGVRQRLVNLGYLEPEGDEEELDVAVIAFKNDHCDLGLTSEALIDCEDAAQYAGYVAHDQAFLQKLVELHGS